MEVCSGRHRPDCPRDSRHCRHAPNCFRHAQIPVVISFTANRTSITDTGGKIVLRATLRYASSCEITVIPSLKRLPRTDSCSSDHVIQPVTFPANKAGNSVTYTFAITVKNSTGSIAGTNVVVTEGAAPPPISFTPPPPGSPTTVVFAPEGVFVADNPLIVTVHNNSSSTQVVTGATIAAVGDSADFILIRNNCGYITARRGLLVGDSVPTDWCW